ncbi:MAG: PIN domain-containing protein [Candidatus Eremiobacterota bacterium]
MQIVDANIILRYLLEDIEELANKASDILENNELFIPNEIIAEVVYVLEKVYKVNRKDIQKSLIEFLNYENIHTQDSDLLKEALEIYSKRQLDFVDTLLLSYNKIKKYTVFTFDKKLMKLLKNQI